MTEAIKTNTIKVQEIQEEMRIVGRQVWLAGLGAVASIEDGGTRLVEQVKTWSQEMEERREKAAARGKKKAAEVEKSARQAADEVGEKAREAARETEAKVEGWTVDLLHRFDVPTRRDFAELEARLEKLAVAVEEWRAQSPSTPRPTAKPAAKATAKATASKPAAAAQGVTVLTVKPHQDGWRIAIEGDASFERLESTKKAAVSAARDLAKDHLPSELAIFRQDGSEQTRSSYDEEAS